MDAGVGEAAVAEGGKAAGEAGVAAGTAEGAATAAAEGTGTAVGGIEAAGVMPAAVPESASSLTAQGLVQTSPGVYEALNAPASTALTASSAARTLKSISTIVSPVASLAATAANVSASRKGAGRGPTVAPPVTMPTFGNPNTIAGQRASIVEQLRRQGRASTILTGSGGDKLGG